MGIRGYSFWKFGESRIADADLEITQLLIVRAVLINDVDHMTDMAA